MFNMSATLLFRAEFHEDFMRHVVLTKHITASTCMMLLDTEQTLNVSFHQGRIQEDDEEMHPHRRL